MVNVQAKTQEKQQTTQRIDCACHLVMQPMHQGSNLQIPPCAGAKSDVHDKADEMF